MRTRLATIAVALQLPLVAAALAAGCGRDWSFLDARDGGGDAPGAGGDGAGDGGADGTGGGADAAGGADGTATDARDAAPVPEASLGRLAVARADTAHNQTVAAYGNFSCGLRSGGDAYCWGANGDLQLGNESVVLSVSPLPVTGLDGGAPLDGVSRITAGGSHACVLRGARVYCWGDGLNGALGNGVTADIAVPTPVTTAGDAALPAAVEVTCGGLQCCAATSDAGVYCWGYDGIDALTGAVDAGTYEYVASAVPADPALAAMHGFTMGTDHACAIDGQGDVVCWGRNDCRQSGQATSVTCDNFDSPKVACTASPTVVAGVADAVQVAAGATHTCALDTHGQVWCWGRADLGQLGVAAGTATCTDKDQPGDAVSCTETPQHVSAVDGAVQVAVGGHASCALRDGQVYCWGSDAWGELGRGSVDADGGANAAPQAVQGPSGDPLDGVAEIAVAFAYACALRGDGTVWCWGSDGTGAIGLDAGISLRAHPVGP